MKLTTFPHLVLASLLLYATTPLCRAQEMVRFDLTKTVDGRCEDDTHGFTATVIAAQSKGKGDKEGILLGLPGDTVEVPMAVCAGERGSVRVVFKGELPRGPMFHLYTPHDGLWLTLESTRVTFSLFRRSSQEYLRTAFPATELSSSDWNDLTASWESGKGLMLLLNGRVLASLPIEAPFVLENPGYLTVGSHQPAPANLPEGVGTSSSFRGTLREIVFALAPVPFRDPERPKPAASAPSPSRAPAPAAPPVAVAAPAPLKPSPFAAMGQAKGVEVVENAQGKGLFNRHMGILFNARSGELEGAWNARGMCLAAHGGGSPSNSLWQVTLRDGQAQTTLTPADFKTVTLKSAGTASGSMTLEARYSGCSAAGISCEVTASVAMNGDTPGATWSIKVTGISGSAGIWQVAYPTFLLPPMAGDASRNRMAICYYQGSVLEDPFCLRTGRNTPRTSSYPSANGLMQFQALYSEDSGDGTYLATEDGRGTKKAFCYDALPSQQRIRYSVVHFPAGRGGQLREYAAPYSLRMVPYRGGWYEAARMYREWALKQEWFAKGPLQTRSDIPNWLREAPIFIKLTGSNFGAQAEENQRSASSAVQEGLAKVRQLFGHDFPVVFYSWRKLDRARCAYGGDCLAHLGHLDVPRLTLTEIFRPLRKEGVHLVTYINSKIYDQVWDPEDAREAEKWAVKDRQGKIVVYSAEALPAWVMCNGTEWWNRRFSEVAAAQVGAMASNGTYMDSFGKGAEECFAANHGHPPGGGDVLVQGQRRMAKAVKEAARRFDPEHVLGGEGSTENYADVLDYTILSQNYYGNYAPLRRAVYGDYMLCHGRSIPPMEAPDRWKVEVGTLFLEGAILGRAKIETGAVDPEAETRKKVKAGTVDILGNPARLAKLQELASYTRHGIEYLRFGELLAPPSVAVGGKISYYPEGQRVPVEAPTVGAGAYRSHKDGSAAVVFFNRGNQECAFDHVFSGKLRAAADGPATLSSLGPDGVLTKVASFKDEHKESVRLAPGEVRFYVIQ